MIEDKPVPIDLRKDVKDVCKHVKKRVREYLIHENIGPGRDADPITMITLGFDFDQACWVSLVFDTRPEATPDGKWYNYIGENQIDRNHWFDRPGEIALHDGSSATIDAGIDDTIVAEYFGAMLRDALVASRDKGVFAELPLTEDCIFCVEHSGGAYGAIEPANGSRSEQTEPQCMTGLIAFRRSRLRVYHGNVEVHGSP